MLPTSAQMTQLEVDWRLHGHADYEASSRALDSVPLLTGFPLGRFLSEQPFSQNGLDWHIVKPLSSSFFGSWGPPLSHHCFSQQNQETWRVHKSFLS